MLALRLCCRAAAKVRVRATASAPTHAAAFAHASGAARAGARHAGSLASVGVGAAHAASARVHSAATVGSRASGSGEQRPWRALLRRAAAWAAASSGLSAAAVASAPYLLSHPLGLKAALGLANGMAPATIHIQSLSAGWGRPLVMSGLSIAEPHGPSAELPAAAPAGRVLLAIQQLSTQQTLWQLLAAAWRLRGSSGRSLAPDDSIRVAASGLAVDCSLDEGGQLRLGRVLRQAGLLEPSAPAAALPQEVDGSSGSGSGADAVAKPGSAAPQWPTASLLYPQCPLDFSARLVLAGGAVQVDLSDGILQVPADVGEMVGQRLRLELLTGQAASMPQEEESPAGGTPLSLQLSSDLLQLGLRGWQAGGRGRIQLSQPVAATAQFTPALAQLVLSRLNPLLASVLSVEGRHAVRASIMPDGGAWPAEGAAVRVEAMQVVMEQSALVKDLLQAVQLGDSRLGRVGSMEAQLSPIEAHLSAGGRVDTRRFDLRLETAAGRRVHLASWGRAHLSEGGPLDVTVCVAGDTLGLLGLSSFSPEGGIPLRVEGTARQPSLGGVARASKLVALLLAQQQADKLSARGVPVPRRMRQELREGLRPFGTPEAFRMPPPVK